MCHTWRSKLVRTIHSALIGELNLAICVSSHLVLHRPVGIDIGIHLGLLRLFVVEAVKRFQRPNSWMTVEPFNQRRHLREHFGNLDTD